MKVLCVDDDPRDLALAVSACRALPSPQEVRGVSSPQEALELLGLWPADAAVLDIRLPGMDGLALAREILRRSPETAIVFLTAHADRAVEAFALHVSGYLLKPLDPARLREEVLYALSRKNPADPVNLRVQTFGQFEVFLRGKPLPFRRAKAKELLAFLVDRRGGSVTRAEAFAVLWEEVPYDRGMQKQLDVIIRSLRSTLREYGLDALMENRHGSLRIVPEMLDCDMYRLTDGDPAAAGAFRGEYMSAYSWASLTESYLQRRFLA